MRREEEMEQRKKVGAPTVPSAVILVPSEFFDSSCQTGVTEQGQLE
jgi:hypothetical protein